MLFVYRIYLFVHLLGAIYLLNLINHTSHNECLLMDIEVTTMSGQYSYIYDSSIKQWTANHVKKVHINNNGTILYV